MSTETYSEYFNGCGQSYLYWIIVLNVTQTSKEKFSDILRFGTVVLILFSVVGIRM